MVSQYVNMIHQTLQSDLADLAGWMVVFLVCYSVSFPLCTLSAKLRRTTSSDRTDHSLLSRIQGFPPNKLFKFHLQELYVRTSLQTSSEVSFVGTICEGNFPGGSDCKASAYNAGDPGLNPGQGRSPGEGNGNPLQYSCLENPMDRGACWATVHGVEESDTTE